MSLGTILLIVLVLVLLGVIPTWPHSRGWGYGPSGILGLILVVVVVLLFHQGVYISSKYYKHYHQLARLMDYHSLILLLVSILILLF